MAISPDGTWLATASIGMVLIWATDGTMRAALEHYGRVRALAISPDGTWLATAGDGPDPAGEEETRGMARIWEADGTHLATSTTTARSKRWRSPPTGG